jgi:hypothetical protein
VLTVEGEKVWPGEEIECHGTKNPVGNCVGGARIDGEVLCKLTADHAWAVAAIPQESSWIEGLDTVGAVVVGKYLVCPSASLTQIRGRFDFDDEWYSAVKDCQHIAEKRD